MRYALVDGVKTEAVPGGRGNCPLCGLEVQAHCGANVPHWTHVNAEECDTWSEPLSNWHRSWQDLVQPAFTEVPRKGRRADLVGTKGFVIVLRQAPISTKDIKAREAFFGAMVWIFDARARFAAVRTGTTAFFSYGADDYPVACSSLVFLDFGSYLVQVTRHTATFALCSGFGPVRSHKWLAQQLLSNGLRPSPDFGFQSATTQEANLWEVERPYWVTDQPMAWFFKGKRTTVPEAEPFIILNYASPVSDTFVWRDVIGKHPELANGWSVASLERMREFLRADIVLLRGGLRLLPTDVKALSYSSVSKAQTRHLLTELETHIGAGRIPVLEESVKDHLLNIAKSDFRR